MDWFDAEGARPLGEGKQLPMYSITDPELQRRVAGYKRNVASRYRAMTPEDDMARFLPKGTLLVSPKVDGELWFLVLEGGDAALVNPKGRVYFGDLPVLVEAKKAAARAEGRVIVAGELFAATKGGRPRVADVATATSGEAQAQVARLGFMAFDLLEGGDGQAQMPLPTYAEKLEVLRRLFEGGKRLQAIRTEEMAGVDAVMRQFVELVDSGKAEGLVLRSEDERIVKLKPVLSIDVAVVGYTTRVEEPDLCRSMLLAVMREDGRFQLIGSCGNMSEEDRRDLKSRLEPLETSSAYRHASSSGALYRFVRPELVVEIKLTDIQGDDSRGDPVTRMTLEFDEGEGWRPVRPMPGASIFFPVFVRVRTDKTVNPTDIRAEQVLERTMVRDLDQKAEEVRLPESRVIRREVYRKEHRGEVTVRKLVVWKTGKEDIDPAYPPYVVHWTDYSPARKDPLKREVRLAPDEAEAAAIGDMLIDKNIKKGWERVDA